MNSINISSILTNKRREKGITQEELASYIGVSSAAVSKWEKGQSYPDITLLPQLAAYFNISVDDLLGYSPQLTREDIWKLCKRLSADFTNKPFDEVISECREITKKYYSCFYLIYHIALLYVNHSALVLDKEKLAAVLAEATTLCRRVVADSGDAMLSKDAIYLQSYCALMLEKPSDVFELLGESVSMQGSFSEGDIIARAFEIAGNVEKAMEVSQCSIYTNLLSLLNSLVFYISMIEANSFETAEVAYQRAAELIRLFSTEQLDANTTAKTYIAGAVLYCKNGQPEKALDCLDAYVDLCMSVTFPLGFRGDSFFTHIDSWLQSDYNSDIPYDDKMIKNNMLSSITAIPEITKALKDESRYQNIIKKLADNVQEGL